MAPTKTATKAGRKGGRIAGSQWTMRAGALTAEELKAIKVLREQQFNAKGSTSMSAAEVTKAIAKLEGDALQAKLKELSKSKPATFEDFLTQEVGKSFAKVLLAIA